MRTLLPQVLDDVSQLVAVKERAQADSLCVSLELLRWRWFEAQAVTAEPVRCSAWSAPHPRCARRNKRRNWLKSPIFMHRVLNS